MKRPFRNLPWQKAPTFGLIFVVLVLFQVGCFSSRTDPFPFEEFIKYDHNPILSPRGNGFESDGVFNPAAIVVNDTIYLFYRAQDENGRSSIGLAKSVDGINFERNPEPLIVAEEDYEIPGGCEDPRIVRVLDTYYLTYTAYDGNTARLALASSNDLLHWEKHGPLLPSSGWTKSGAIITEQVNGRYGMYFG
ncbi:hypothetical protein ACFLZR_00500, partial [Candidatus Neomarinimicrobiota bacterium]